MKPPGNPVRTTIVVGLASGLLFLPVSSALSLFLPWPVGFRFTIWIFLAAYGAVLCRWSGTGLPACWFPLGILFASMFKLKSNEDFLLLVVLILGWLRSGVCFPSPVWKALGVEVLVGLGGAALVACFAPASMTAWALGVWMFFLVQSLYFVLTGNTGVEDGEDPADPFERARRGAEDILSAGGG